MWGAARGHIPFQQSGSPRTWNLQPGLSSQTGKKVISFKVGERFFLKKELLSYSLQLRNKQLKIFKFSLHPEILHASAVRWYMCYWTNFDMGMNLSGDKFELIRSLSSLTCKRSIWEIFQIKKRNCTFLNQLHLFSTVYINEVKLTPSYIQ